MLLELRIRNLAVVEDAVIRFGPGLNAMTGSTGAGKSIVLAAVELLSGARARRSLIRAGAESLVVEGAFSIEPGARIREALGMAPDEREVSIRRELGSDGRNRIWINGMSATVGAAQEAAGALIELHGQHRQQEFLDPASHILYLDARGDYGDLLDACMRAIDRYVDLSRRLAALAAAAERTRSQEEFLRFQLRELEALRLEPGLDRGLDSRIGRITHRQRFVGALDEALELLEGEGASAIDRISRAARAVETLAAVDPAWREAAAELAAARVSVQDVARRIARERSGAEEGEEDLEALQERLAAIQRAMRKYGLPLEGLIERRDEIAANLLSLEGGAGEIEETRRAREEAKGDLLPMLAELGRRRASAAKALDRLVTAELAKLGMGGAIFETRVAPLENNAFQDDGLEIHLSPRGGDSVEFMIRTNVGERIHPLADVVSGGELSRISLVLKKLQVEDRRIPTLVFDEIDAGLGADLGGVVAERLVELAERYQIICITHLPQAAARAATHIKVVKRVRGGRTIASAAVIDGPDRVAEIARMLGGDGKLRTELAEELLEKSSVRP
jgi:DNA repair protein RecN (Recombination protein N)